MKKIMVNGIELGYEVETDEGTGKRYAVITGIARKARGDLVIPAEIGGHPVTSIGERAFFCCSDLTSVTIPNSVTSIGEGAFYECTNLTSVTIPDSVTSIGDSAFCKCSSLTSVSIGNGVTSIGEGAFYGCWSLTRVEGMTRIWGTGIFSNPEFSAYARAENELSEVRW